MIFTHQENETLRKTMGRWQERRRSAPSILDNKLFLEKVLAAESAEQVQHVGLGLSGSVEANGENMQRLNAGPSSNYPRVCNEKPCEETRRQEKTIGDDPSQWAKRLKRVFCTASHVQVNSNDPEPSGNSHTESEAETSPSFGCTSLVFVFHNVSTDFAVQFSWSRRFACADISHVRLAEEVGDLMEKLRESDEQLQAG